MCLLQDDVQCHARGGEIEVPHGSTQLIRGAEREQGRLLYRASTASEGKSRVSKPFSRPSAIGKVRRSPCCKNH